MAKYERMFKLCMQYAYSVGTETGIVLAGKDPKDIKAARCATIDDIISKYSIRDSLRECGVAESAKKLIDAELRDATDHRTYPNETFRNKPRNLEMAQTMHKRSSSSSSSSSSLLTPSQTSAWCEFSWNFH